MDGRSQVPLARGATTSFGPLLLGALTKAIFKLHRLQSCSLRGFCTEQGKAHFDQQADSQTNQRRRAINITMQKVRGLSSHKLSHNQTTRNQGAAGAPERHHKRTAAASRRQRAAGAQGATVAEAKEGSRSEAGAALTHL